MERLVSDRNVLNEFVADFVKVLGRHKVKYILVSGFVAIAHGRSRGTEDVDLIIERLPKERFLLLHMDLIKEGFECLQGNNPAELFGLYLSADLSLRYVRKGWFVPEMELKAAKDPLDEYQLQHRVKLPLTGLPFYFSDIETNLAFKEELLKSEKDLEDARHLRIIYSGKISENKIK